MHNKLTSLIFTLVVCSLAIPPASAQPGTFQTEYIRMRMEQGILRQRAAVENMAASIASQQRALTRQRSVSLAVDFFRPPWVPRRHGPQPPACETLESGQVDSLVESAAATSSLDPELIRGVMKQESDFRPCAVSPKGAVGLMQLEPATASELGVKDLFDPSDNVLGGARLLKQLMDRYGGDLRLALSAYNAGAARVDAIMDVPKIPETVNYVNQIIDKLPPALQPKPSPIKILPRFQYDLNKAPSTIFWLMGNDGGK